MKPYRRERIKDFPPITKLLGIPDDPAVAETYIKPHGRRLIDGKVICWRLSRDWKTILFAARQCKTLRVTQYCGQPAPRRTPHSGEGAVCQP